MALPKSFDKQRRAVIKFWLRFRIAIIATVVGVAVLGAGIFGWQTWQEGATEKQQTADEASARFVASDVKQVIASMLGGIDEALDVPALAALVDSADGDGLASREAELQAAVPGALGVRILDTGARDPDYDVMPPITYAALEMMRDATESGEAPPPEVLLLGEEEQHIAVLRALRTAEDAPVSGFVLFGLDPKLLSTAVSKANMPSGYAELIQSGSGRAVIARKGNAAFRQGIATASLPITGTRLRVQFWSDAGGVTLAQDDPGGLPLLPMAVVVVLLAGAGGAFVFLRKRKAALAGAAAGKEGPGPTGTPGSGDGEAVKGEAPAAEELPERPTTEGMDVHHGEHEESEPEELADVIFRAYDIRGVVGETLTTAAVKQIGLALGSEAYDRGQQTLCVGCDGRNSSPEMVAALVEGLRESGRDVIDVGRVPTPVLYFATYYLETSSGVMVTGSHNPPEYNGLKMMLGGDTLFGDDIQALKARIQKQEFSSGAGNLQSMDISADYIRRVSEDIPVALGNAFKVVVDCGNGIAGDFAPKLIRALGHDVVDLYCDVDGSFPNHHPDPSQPENLEDLINAVKSNDADLGFAFDGDGDRLGVVDATGHIVWPDAQMMLFARDVLSRNAGAEIVFDVKCSSRLSKVISKLGGKPVMFKTGHSFIKNKLKETGSPLAGEMSGHIFFKERWYGFDDALYAAARMLEILMGFKQKPAEVFAKLPAGVSTPELRVDMEEGENLSFMASLSDTSQFGDGRVTSIDGVRVDWDDGWGLVRASNTTPSLVLRFEGDDEAALERIKDVFRKLLLDKKPDLTLPF